MPVLAITLIFLALSGLLWYERPSANLWLLGSLGLFAVWGGLFMHIITRATGRKI